MRVEINYIRSIDCIPDYKVRDSHGVLRRHAVTEEELLQLCGGIPCRNILFVNIEIVSITENTLTVAVNTDQYEVFRTINFAMKRISNETMRVYEKDQYIGTSLFLNQVSFARKLGFIKLNTFAMEHDGHERWDGYYRWARLGYQMNDQDDLKDLRDLMHFFSRPETTLGELVLSENGYAFWKSQGFGWSGEFLLTDDSASMIHLRRYLDLKNIDFIL